MNLADSEMSRVAADLGAYSIYPWTAALEPVQVVSFLPGSCRAPQAGAEMKI